MEGGLGIDRPGFWSELEQAAIQSAAERDRERLQTAQERKAAQRVEDNAQGVLYLYTQKGVHTVTSIASIMRMRQSTVRTILCENVWADEICAQFDSGTDHGLDIDTVVSGLAHKYEMSRTWMRTFLSQFRDLSPPSPVPDPVVVGPELPEPLPVAKAKAKARKKRRDRRLNPMSLVRLSEYDDALLRCIATLTEGGTYSEAETARILGLPLLVVQVHCMVSAYRGGASLGEVGEPYRVTPPTVRRILVANGVPIRRRGRPRIPGSKSQTEKNSSYTAVGPPLDAVRTAAMFLLREEGLTLEEIGNCFGGVAASAVYLMLRRHEDWWSTARGSLSELIS